MLSFLMSLLVTAILLILVGKLVDGIEIKGFGAALASAIVLGLANAFLGPIATVIALPLNILTLGLLWWLIRWLINAVMLWITAAIVPGFRVSGFAPAFWGAAVLALGNVLVGWIF